ncbi:LIM domain and actin-binding protein 1 [Homalodisca vitripennis]|nr:LIM domain and actin-binding protein 1 [Homalodisca vitripennis]
MLSDIVRASDPTDDVVVATADVSDKFKFFETYKAPEKERKAFRITPPREGQVKVKPAPLHRCVLCLANMSYASDLSVNTFRSCDVTCFVPTNCPIARPLVTRLVTCVDPLVTCGLSPYNVATH